jgi:arsenate reductase
VTTTSGPVTSDGRSAAPATGPHQPPRIAVPPVVRRLTAELTGTAFLVAGVVGSGIMAERLTDDRGLQLLQNTAATAGVLVALILALGPASGAHFNPAVTLVDRIFGGLDTPTAAGYVVAQVAGGIVGAVAANLMFDLPPVEWSTTVRAAGYLWFAEGVATLGLLMVIFGVVRSGRSAAAAVAVGGYIAGAYYFTSSTSFANPAVTVGRAFSDTFAGIEPAAVPMFVVAQLAGAAVATGLILVIYPHVGEVADRVIVPHEPHVPHEPAKPDGPGKPPVSPSDR